MMIVSNCCSLLHEPLAGGTMSHRKKNLKKGEDGQIAQYNNRTYDSNRTKEATRRLKTNDKTTKPRTSKIGYKKPFCDLIKIFKLKN